jgi:hypothetical protein
MRRAGNYEELWHAKDLETVLGMAARFFARVETSCKTYGWTAPE